MLAIPDPADRKRRNPSGLYDYYVKLLGYEPVMVLAWGFTTIRLRSRGDQILIANDLQYATTKSGKPIYTLITGAIDPPPDDGMPYLIQAVRIDHDMANAEQRARFGV